MWWLKIVVIALLWMMAWQDWKFRAISIWLFIIVGLGLIGLKYQAEGWLAFFADLKANLLFLSFQFLALFGYFAIRHKKFVNLFAGYLGEGDLIFLILIACYLSFGNFLVFYVGSLVIIILLGFYLRRRNPKIPLAGAQAFLLTFAMLLEQLFPLMSLTQDFWLKSFYPY